MTEKKDSSRSSAGPAPVKQVHPSNTATENRSVREWLLLATLLLAVIFKFCGSPDVFKYLKLAEPDPSVKIPSSYAICTPSGARIYTVDDQDTKVECLLVDKDKISITGTKTDIQTYWKASNSQSALKVFETKPGSIIVPGLADAHAHLLEWGFKQQLPLEGSVSVDEIIDKLRAYVLSHPDVREDKSRWILGLGWDQTRWPETAFPTADDFDREPLLRGRLIALSRVDVHALWVSNAVLETIGGSLPETVDGGLIVRDKNHKPTGVFVDNAMDLIPVPPWTDEQTAEYFEIAVRDAFSVGLTSVHDAMSTPHHIEFFKKMADERQLPIRLYLMGHIPSEEYWGKNLTRLIDYGIDGRLNLRSVKLFTDGALGSWGAALLDPYTDDPSTSGLMRIDESKLKALVEKFYADGWQTNIHCIGDRANKVVIDIFEEVLSSGQLSVDEWRPRIEHAQIMRPEDLGRTGRLGIIASVQPTHATSDMWYAEKRLGPDRMKGAYAYQSLLRYSRKGILPLGSDFPVEGINPLLGFYAAVSRLSVSGDSPNGTAGWYPAEALTRTQALRGMTRDAAYASFAEKSHGMLLPGMKADFVILDRDIVDEKQVKVGDILGAKVLGTVVDGEVVYGRL